MPSELMKCVDSVKNSGKDESSAYAICSSKTGWKREKNGWKNKKTGKVYKEASEFEVLMENSLRENSQGLIGLSNEYSHIYGFVPQETRTVVYTHSDILKLPNYGNKSVFADIERRGMGKTSLKWRLNFSNGILYVWKTYHVSKDALDDTIEYLKSRGFTINQVKMLDSSIDKDAFRRDFSDSHFFKYQTFKK